MTAQEVDDLMQELSKPEALVWRKRPDFWSHYSIDATLGSGQFGKVLSVVRSIDGKQFALKLLSDVDDSTLNEIGVLRLATKLCPELIQYLGAVEIPAAPGSAKFKYGILMELVNGQTMLQQTDQGPVPLSQIRQWLQQLASQLACLHRAGIVHADIKGENVMINRQGNAKLIDFGLSCTTENRTSKEVDECKFEEPRGTNLFMAPEWSRGDPWKNEFERMDIYSLGITMLEALLGHRRLRSIIADQNGNVDLDEVRRNAEKISDWVSRNGFAPSDPVLQGLLMRMVSLSPKVRPTAEEILSKLANSVPR